MGNTSSLALGGNYECNIPLLADFNATPFFPEGTSYEIHLCRSIVYAGCIVYYEYMRRRTPKVTHTDNVMLPILTLFIVLYFCLNVIVTCTSGFGFVIQIQSCTSKYVNLCIALQTSLFHLLYEGMAVFLCKYGIGLASIRSSLFVGFIWAGISFVFFFITTTTICHGFSLPLIDKYVNGSSDESVNASHRNEVLAITLFLYKALLAAFYGVIWLAPMHWFYRRPAAFYYAKMQFCIQIYWILCGIVIITSYKSDYLNNIICTISVMSDFVLIVFLPYIICRTLMIDSHYWQGLLVPDENPTSQLFTRNNVDTATTLAQRVGSLETSTFMKRNVPVLHFGQLKLDPSKGYICGGFSRIYFGMLLPEKQVAIKVIYAMEFSPDEILSMSYEAQVLSELKHPNIVTSCGICVMPPALALVTEFCSRGSLFTFLYKPASMKLLASDDFDTEKSRHYQSIMTLFSGTDLRPLIYSTTSSVLGSGAASAGSTLTTLDSARSSIVSKPDKQNAVNPEVMNAVTVEGRWSQSHAEMESRRFSEWGAAPDMLASSSEILGSARSSLHDPIIGRANTREASVDTSVASSVFHPITEHQVSGRDVRNNKSDRKDIYGIEDCIDSHGDANVLSSRTTKKLPATSEAYFHSAHQNRHRDANTFEMNKIHKHQAQDKMAELAESAERGVSKMKAGVGTHDSGGMYVSMGLSLGVQANLHLRLKMMLECASAIAFVHSKGFMHCDIKSLNFLVAEDYTVKLADFGDARPADPKQYPDLFLGNNSQPLPSRIWAAPELLFPGINMKNSYIFASDVYGLAIVLAELVTCKLPFPEVRDTLSPMDWYEHIQDNSFRPNLANDFGVPKPVLDVIQGAWRTIPGERCSAQDLCNVLIRILESGKTM